MEFVKKVFGSFFCEWKGNVIYWMVYVDGCSVEKVGWSYESFMVLFCLIKFFIVFYVVFMDVCYVGDE